ncbi:MAG: T9SS type A sorting domain-containing protein [Bacteroidales bacterium]|nr:T9SS type A sorting domain-containing protein [Bacteroidales bacterium]
MTLEHTFEERVYLTLYGDGYWTVASDDDFSSCIVTIYDSDYSLYKQVTFNPHEGYERIIDMDISVFSTELILVPSFFQYDDYFGGQHRYSLYDTNGNIIKDWGDGVFVDLNYVYSHFLSNNILVFSCTDQETGQEYTEIYSIDGYESTSEKNIRSFGHAYPNPARNTISLPYNLNKGEQAEMLIYDVNGRMIDKKRIDSTFNKILLNVESYTPGVYFYSVNGVSQKFVVK